MYKPIIAKKRNNRRRGKGAGSVGRMNATLPGDGKTEAYTVATMRLENRFRIGITKVDVIVSDFALLTTSITSFTSGAFSFAAGDVFAVQPAYLNLFDQYRIVAVECLFKPNSVNTSFPNFFTAIDFDNKAIPTLVTQIEAYSTCVCASAGQYVRRVFRPRAGTAYFNTSLTQGYGLQEYGAWMDCGSPNVPHYGLNYYITQSAAVYSISMGVKFTMEFMATI